MLGGDTQYFNPHRKASNLVMLDYLQSQVCVIMSSDGGR